jgi:hypothetical protein
MPTHTLGGVERIRELLRAHRLEIRQLPEGVSLDDEVRIARILSI